MSLLVGAGEPNSPARRSCLFYKLMVASILQDKKLRIPERFVRKYGDELSSIATLTVPNGRVWVVELRKANQRLWFHEGWHQFVEHYSIHVGYFLVFRYEGNSNFNVHIFNLPPSEIKYSCDTISGPQKLSHGEQCLELHDKAKEGGASAEKLDGCLYYRRKKLKNSTNEAVGESMYQRKDAGNLQVKFQSTRDMGIQFDSSKLTNTEDELGLLFSDEGEQRSRRRTQSTEPCMYEPESSAKDKVEAEVPGMKSCSKHWTSSWRAVSAVERERTIRAAEMFKPVNPFCRVILRPSYVYKGFVLHLPTGFAREYLNGVTGFITLQVSDGKQWPVRFTNWDGQFKLSTGWPNFVWDNNLEEGDVCVFELIKTEGIVLKVTIFRVPEDAGQLNQVSSKGLAKLN